MNPTAEPATISASGPTGLASLLARAEAMFSRHEAAKAPPPVPAPKAPRTFRITEAKQGGAWVDNLTPEQREAAGLAEDWKAQAIEEIGGIPPAPPRRIGRPRKIHAPVVAPPGLITELPGEVDTFDPFAPTAPVPRPRTAETAPAAEVARPRAVQLAFPFVALLVADAARPAQRMPTNAPRRPREQPESSRLSRAGPGLRPTRPGTNTRTPGGPSWTSSSDRRAAFLEESGQLSFLRLA